MTTESHTQVQSFDWKHLFFSFEGRTRRSHFWIGWLVCLGAGVVFGWIPLLGFILSIAMIWPNLAITVMRLHEMGHTGWLAAIPYVVGILPDSPHPAREARPCRRPAASRIRR